LNTKEEVENYLARSRFLNNKAVIEPLTGGVSSAVWKIKTDYYSWVLKQALEKLRVEAEWYSDITRIHREHEVLEALFSLLPEGTIPNVVHTDYVHHVYIMTSAEEGALTWKEVLMNGEFNKGHAVNAASLLRTLHEQSTNLREPDKVKFEDQTYFDQLRIAPFHRHVGSRYPELAPFIEDLIFELTHTKECLVHGDFSPKNILLEKHNTVLIDFEVAHWGNPVFDAAFCLCHLMLKGWHLNKQKEALALIEIFLKTYVRKLHNLVPHLGLMLLARMDGKSPVAYIRQEELKDRIRRVAKSWIQGKLNISDPLEMMEKAYSQSQMRY
jgi:aminoglycoside phosphotransferase (APT) family kinase protein